MIEGAPKDKNDESDVVKNIFNTAKRCVLLAVFLSRLAPPLYIHMYYGVRIC